MKNLSVPTYRRKLSNTEYLWQIYLLCARTGEIVANKPKKYKGTFSDRLVNLSLQTLELAIRANEIRVTNKEEYLKRKSLLTESKQTLWSYIIIFDLFLEACIKSPNTSQSKIIKEQIELGERVSSILKMIDGVLKSDKERYVKL